MKCKESRRDRMERVDLQLPNISMVDMYFEKWQAEANKDLEDMSPIANVSSGNLSLTRDKYFDKIGSIMEKVQDLSSMESSTDNEDLSYNSNDRQFEEGSEIEKSLSAEGSTNSNKTSHSSKSVRKSGWRRRGWFTGFPSLPSPSPPAPPSSPSPFRRWTECVQESNGVAKVVVEEKSQSKWSFPRADPTPPEPPPLDITPIPTPIPTPTPASTVRDVVALPPRKRFHRRSWPPAPPPPHLPPARSLPHRSSTHVAKPPARSLSQRSPTQPARTPLPKRKQSKSPPSQSLSSRTPLSQKSSPPMPPPLPPSLPFSILTRSLSLTARPVQSSCQSLPQPQPRIPGLFISSKTSPKFPQLILSNEANLRGHVKKKTKLSDEIKHGGKGVKRRALSNSVLGRSRSSASDSKQAERRPDVSKKSAPDAKMRNRFSVKVPRKESLSQANQNQSDQNNAKEEKAGSEVPSQVMQKLSATVRTARSTLEIREAMLNFQRPRAVFQQKPTTGQNLKDLPCFLSFKAATGPRPQAPAFLGRRAPADGLRKRPHLSDFSKYTPAALSKPKSPDMAEVKKFIMGSTRHESTRNVIDKNSQNKKQSNLARSPRKNKISAVGCVRSTRNCWDQRISPWRFYTTDGLWNNPPRRPLHLHF